MSDRGADITELLGAWYGGDAAAGERLLPLVYGELRRIAAAELRRERHAATLQPTALVNEAFLRLVGLSGADFPDRSRFYAFAATVMRRLLVDRARRRLAAKRPQLTVTLPTDLPGRNGRELELIALDDALSRLAADHQRQARVVELRFFAGLPEGEIASLLGVTARTVKRDWAFARAWLLEALGTGGA